MSDHGVIRIHLTDEEAEVWSRELARVAKEPIDWDRVFGRDTEVSEADIIINVETGSPPVRPR